jgi:glucose-1-phosphate cytidylyltransferase
MILCGGKGTRLRATSESLPKPLVEIGGMPVLWHVVQIYAAQGFTEFELLTGHRGDMIEAFAAACDWPEGVTVRCIDTGEETQTGGRVKLAFDANPAERVCITYADGVASVDLARLLSFHSDSGSLATMTIVRPELPFGVAMTDGDFVTGFIEKPVSSEWINGGFMIFEREALSSIDEKFLTNDFDYQISLDPDDYWVRVGNKDVTYEIRESSIGEKVSAVSGLSLIRQHMLDSTHDLVLNSGFEGVVVEGRDITTVVFPSAQTRILLTASEEVRLSRRSAELPEGISIAEQITKRDQNDAKVVDFFSPAQGVELVDSTELDFGSTVETIIRIIERTK